MARAAAVKTFTPRRNSARPQTLPARSIPDRTARAITSGPSYEEGLELEEVLQPEHPAQAPLRGRPPGLRPPLADPRVVGGIHVEGDPSRGIEDGGNDLRRSPVAEALPPVPAIPFLLD